MLYILDNLILKITVMDSIDSNSAINPFSQNLEDKGEEYWDSYDLAEEEAYDQDWEEYYKFSEEDEKKWDEKREQELREIAEEKRRQERLYDFSGDDSSLDARFW